MAKRTKTKSESEKPVEGNRTVEILKKIEASNEGASLGLTLMDATQTEKVPCNSSGVFSLDLALGGGYPRGRVIEVYGPEGGGKTTLGLHAIAEAQRQGNVAAMVDTEHAYDPTYGARLGVDSSRMLFTQPNSGEEALTAVSALCDHMTGGDIILVDSVASLTPQAELDGEMGDAHIGLQARLMGQALRKLTGKISDSGVLVIFINQIRHKIGVVFGSNETTPGGKALKFYASQRIDVRFIGRLKEKDKEGYPLGQVVRVKVVKNKIAPPFKEVELGLYYGYGFLQAADTFTIGVKEKVIDQSGAFYSFGGERIGQGKEKAKHFLADNPEYIEKIQEAIRVKYGAA